jgi:RHS repeat-associated protein
LGDIITSSTDNVNSNWTYTYDDFTRLSSAVQSGGQTFNYSYDPQANRWGTISGSNQFTFNDTTNHISNAGVTYDSAGNVTYDGFHSYSYDAEGRLKQVDSGNTAIYNYDSFGHRSMQYAPPVYNEYVVDLTGRAITAVAPGTSTVYTAEVFAGGRHWVTDNGSALFLGADWVGTSRALTNLSGTFDQLYTSLPWGDSLSFAGNGSSFHTTSQYTGKEYDPEANLYHFPARQYAPVQGRWLTPDPAGMAAVDVTNPQTWNRYAYVTNNPVSFADPMGLDSESSSTDSSGNITDYTSVDVTASFDLNSFAPVYSSSIPNTIGGFQVPGETVNVTATPPSGPSGIMSTICSWLPQGRTLGANYSLGGVGGQTSSVEMVVNYNTGQTSGFLSGGAQAGWNGGVSGSVFSGFIYGPLNGDNSGYSGGFTTTSIPVYPEYGLNAFVSASSGGLTGPSGVVPTPGGVSVVGVSAGGSLLNTQTGGVSVTNYTKPLSFGKWGLTTPIDFLLFLARRGC